MRKTYLIGLLLTLILIGVRLFIVFDLVTIPWIIKEILLTLLVGHLYIGLSFLGKMINESIFQSWIHQLHLQLRWFYILMMVIAFGYLYLIMVDQVYFPAFLISGTPLFISGYIMTSARD